MTARAPIALFVYKRPRHAERTIAALARCPESQDSDLIVFSDGPREDSQREAVEATRDVVRGATGFRSVRLVSREQNLGLSRNIIDGVGKAFVESERLVVVEDDIEVAPDFLTFMNAALEHYAARSDIFSISGYLYPVTLDADYSYDSFLFSRFSCWGWATWRDRWNSVEWQKPNRTEFLGSREFWQMWRVSNDLPQMMLELIDGRNDSWAILVNYVQILNSSYSVHPVRSLTYNTGFDGTGTHARRIQGSAIPATEGFGIHGRFRFADTYDEGYAEPLRKFFAHRFRRRLKNLVVYGRSF